MRKQFNIRLPEKIITLIRRDSRRYARPGQSIIERLASLFYAKKRSEREPTILSIPPRKGGKTP